MVERYAKPHKMLLGDEPSVPPVPCDNQRPHCAHAWDEMAEPEEVLFAEEALLPQRLRFERHWCRGAGHLEGYL